MNNTCQPAASPEKRQPPGRRGASLRYPLLRISVICSDTAEVEPSLQELQHAQFRVKADVALSLEQFTKRPDDLKKINDRYGHLVGSQALCRLANALSMGCRDIDTGAFRGETRCNHQGLISA